jgi:hypothetical protein
MLRNESIFEISTLICLSSISICNLLIDLPMYKFTSVILVENEVCAIEYTCQIS